MARFLRTLSLERTVSIVLAAIGLYVAVEGARLGIGTISVPDAGFFPFVTGAALMVLALVHIARNPAGPTENVDAASVAWHKPAFLAAALVGYVLILEPLGFVLATFLLAIAIMRLAYPTPWLVIIPVSAGVSALTYAVFDILLGVSLPTGLLG